MPFVVTLPVSAVSDPLRFANNAKDTGADVLEVRGDLTPEVMAFVSPLPIMVSPRGADTASMIERLKPAYIDIDHSEPVSDIPKSTKLIYSYHNYECVPSKKELEKIIDHLLRKRPAIIKIACRANSYRDLGVLEDVSKSLHAKKMPSIVLAMGEYAGPQRLLSPWRDHFTYTCLQKEDASAPGQILLSEYHAIHVKKKPKLFGILGGAQVASSFSPKIHNALFAAHGIDALYTTFPASDLRDAWEGLVSLGIAGCSVTAPWKQEIVPLLHALHGSAQTLGSVNTVLQRDGMWVGENTDVAGIERGYPFLLDAKHALILGAGGVVPSVIAALKSLRVEKISVWARRREMAAELATRFGCTAVTDIQGETCDVCIKAISEDVPLPLPQFTSPAVAIDLQYGKKTVFIKEAERRGVQVFDGLPMLIAQALEQFRLFTGILPSPSDLSLISSLFHGKQ